jgi:hypothetical protein
MLKSLAKFSISFFVKVILLSGGRIDNRMSGTYLVWVSKGFMAIPPLPYEIKLSSK